MDDQPELTAIELRDARMALIPAVYKTNHERLACELALRLEPAEDVFARYGYDAVAAVTLMESPGFSGMLEKVSREIQANGLSFRNKARAIAEDLLPHAYEMATDPFVSASVRADLIQWAAKVGDLEPKRDDKDQKAGGGLVLNITFTHDKAPVLERMPVIIEQEAQG